MKFSASAPTLLAVAVALAARAVSVDAKLGSTDWDVRGDASDADQALRQLKGGGTNGTGKSKSKSGGDDESSSCSSGTGAASGAAAAALADQVCPSDNGLLYPAVTGSDVTLSTPNFNTPAALRVLFGCVTPVAAGGIGCDSFDSCTTCVAGGLAGVSQSLCASELATLSFCGLGPAIPAPLGPIPVPEDPCADPDFLLCQYQTCLKNEAVYSPPFWYNSDSDGSFKFTECSEEIATRGYGSFQGIIPEDKRTAKSTIEYWSDRTDLYNNKTSVLEYVEFDFKPKPGTCDDCTADKCGDVAGSKVSLTLYTRNSALSPSVADCTFTYAPRVCPQGEWTTFRATFNGASTNTPLRATGSCAADAKPYDAAFANYVLGRNFLGQASFPNIFRNDIIFSINVGDGSTDNSGLEVYVDNVRVKYAQEGQKPLDVDIYDLENEDYEDCISSGTGKSKSKSN